MKLAKVCGMLSLAVFAVLACPASGQKPALAMLDTLEAGNWELREHGAAGSVRNICLNNGRTLIQLKHPGAVCARVVVEDKTDEVTVQYTCHGQGFGRTHIRRESASLIQIDSQGIVNGSPFSLMVEGRKVGNCGR